MNIQQEIKELRERLDELEKQVSNPIGRYIPESFRDYYYLTSNGDTIRESYMSTCMDKYRIQVGNCFKTEKEAEKHKRILINTQKLKDLAERLNNGQEIDWNDTCLKYYIYLKDDKLDCDWNRITQMQGCFYCLDENFLEKAIEEIGEKELIELIKG